VLHGDYTRSDTDHILVHGDKNLPYVAYYYDGTDVTLAHDHADEEWRIGAMAFELLASEALPIVYSIRKGDPVNLFITVDDVDAQATLSAILDPDDEMNGAAGIIDLCLQDRRLSRAEAQERAAARLELMSTEDISCHYVTLDRHTHPSRTVVFDVADPVTFSDTLKIKLVVRTWADADPPIFPFCNTDAANKLLTFEQLLNRVQG
jgi:hypothetical protein